MMIQEAIDTIPGAAAQFAQLADGLRQGASIGRAAYKATHWGQKGLDAAAIQSIPDASAGVIELGRLAEITYLTKKGRDRRIVAYQHRFGVGARDPEGRSGGSYGRVDSMPILACTYEESPSGLVVVRDKSRYTVTDHGIEG